MSMKKIAPLESGIQKIKNALNQAIQSGTSNVKVTLPEKEYKAVMRDFYAEIVKPDNHSNVA